MRPATTISYLRMDHPPKGSKPDLQILRASPFAPWYFLALYRAIGAQYHWSDMLELPPKALEDYCNDPNQALYSLIHRGQPAGMFLLNQEGANTDLGYFGLTPNALGQGLGSALLDYAIHQAWERKGISSMSVNTCTLDHERALPLYLSRGFVVFKTEERPAHPILTQGEQSDHV